jgi:prepilin-type N-terminal cleavage/methylation domain-containing protein
MPRKRRNRDDEGFTIVEVMVAMSVFAILATAFASTLSGSLRSLSLSRQRTTAEQLASSQVEEMRRVEYDDLGTVGGNPPGTVTPTKTVTSGNQTLTVTTRITYVNDRAPSAKETGADYKSVVVTVTAAGATVLAKEQTLVAPPNQASQTDGLIKVQVVEPASVAAVPGATVALGTGPDAPISDTTDAAGNVAFASLTPTPSSGTTSTYSLTATAPGYQTVPSDLPPAAAVKFALAAGQTVSTTIRMYKPVTMNLRLVDAAGAPFTAATTVAVSSSTETQTMTVTGGSAAVTSVGSSPLLPNVQYSVGATATGLFSAATPLSFTGYPNVLATTVTVVMRPYTAGKIQATVKNSAGSNLNGITVVITGGPASILVSGVTNTSGQATISVPIGTSPVYTITVPPQSSYASASTTKAGPTSSTSTVAVSLTLASA